MVLTALAVLLHTAAAAAAKPILQCQRIEAEAFNRFDLRFAGYSQVPDDKTTIHYLFDIAEHSDSDDCDQNSKCCSLDYEVQTVELELTPECAAAFAGGQAQVLLDGKPAAPGGFSLSGNKLNILHDVHAGNPDQWTLLALAFPASHACSKDSALTGSGPCPATGCNFRLVISEKRLDTPQGCTSEACAAACCIIKGNSSPGKSIAGLAEAFQCKAPAAAVPGPNGPAPEVDTRSDTEFPVKFLVLGDWGAALTPSVSNRENPDRRAQRLVAQAMATTAECQKSQFVVSMGDNFYQAGLRMANDTSVHDQFRSVYQSYPSLRPLKWYSVYGNHDYPYGETSDPAVKRECLLQNITWAECQKRPCCYSSMWQRTAMMRDPRWTMENGTIMVNKHPLLDLVLIDTNPFIKSYWSSVKAWPNTPEGLAAQDPAETRRKMNEALAASNATWRIVVGHHPLENMGRRCGAAKLFNQKVDECAFLTGVKQDLWAHNIPLYLNGHDHSQQLTTNTTGGKTYFLTSGAGGRKCDPVTKAPSLLWPNLSSLPNTFMSDNGFATVAVSAKRLVLKLYTIGKNGPMQGLAYQLVLDAQDYKPKPRGR